MINQLVYEAINNQYKIKLGKYDSKFHNTIPENPNHSISLDDHKNKHTILVNGKKAGIVAVKDLSHPFWQIRIHPDHRGTGLLEKSAHALAKKYNKKELVATINKDNIASTKSHSNAGFTRDHEKEKSLSEKGLLNPENHLYSKKF
jgi:RimJ/RimL family protein N-acetyltransferase